MPEQESLPASTTGKVNHPLCESLFAVRCLFLLCVMLSVFSAIAFLFQVCHRDEFGDVFRDQPGAWPHLFGHLLRSAVGAFLAWYLWRYLQAAKKTINADLREPLYLFRALALWWNSLAISGIALVLYGAWVAFVTGPPVITHSLSPRFKSESPDKAQVKVEFRLAEADPGEGLTQAKVMGTSQIVFLRKEPPLTNKDIAEARVVLSDNGEPAVSVKFVPAVHQKVREATAKHRGKPLAILVDGRVVSAPIVQFQVGEAARITGAFSREEAERIAKGISGRE